MIANYSTFQLLQMMTDEDFAYIMDNDPSQIQSICISLTLELTSKGKEQLLN